MAAVFLTNEHMIEFIAALVVGVEHATITREPADRKHGTVVRVSQLYQVAAVNRQGIHIEDTVLVRRNQQRLAIGRKRVASRTGQAVARRREELGRAVARDFGRFGGGGDFGVC